MKKKNKFTKIFGSIVILILLLILFVGILITLFGDRALKSGIEKGGTYALKVPVNLEDVKLSILGGSLALDNLEIDNPEGYQHPQFLKMGHAYTELNTGSLLSDTIEIEKIQLDEIELVIEQKGLTNNLQQILSALPKSEDEPEDDNKPGKNLLIKELIVSKVSVKVKLLPVPGKIDTIPLELAPIHMTDLGTDNKLDIAGLIAKLITSIAVGVAEQGKDVIPLDILGPLTDQITQQGQQILEEGQKLIEQAGEGLLEGGKDVGEQATDALKGLFQKKDKK